MKWVPIKEIAVDDNVGAYRVRKICNTTIVVERLEDEWMNITDECKSKLVTSCRSADENDGSKYLALCFKNRLIAIYKPGGTLKLKDPRKFKIVKGKCATYSFNVFMKVN